MNPLLTNAYLGVPAGITTVPDSVKHKKIASASNINMRVGLSGLPVQTPQFPLNPYTYDAHSNYDGSSRSTSAYSLMPNSAGPLLCNNGFVPAYPGTHADAERTTQTFKFRLPSDQLDQIIHAVHPQAQNQQPGTNPGAAMLPPPLPLHTLASKDNAIQSQPTASLTATAHPPFDYDVGNFIDRRAESRYSDISMHAGCDSFPTCTTEDAEGHIVHNGNTNNVPSAPATVVRGRKEGSSPTKRKLSHSSKKADKEERAKKRPRRSTRLLQHDSGYDGSDESSFHASHGHTVAGPHNGDRRHDSNAGHVDVEQSGGSSGQ